MEGHNNKRKTSENRDDSSKGNEVYSIVQSKKKRAKGNPFLPPRGKESSSSADPATARRPGEFPGLYDPILHGMAPPPSASSSSSYSSSFEPSLLVLLDVLLRFTSRPTRADATLLADHLLRRSRSATATEEKDQKIVVGVVMDRPSQQMMAKLLLLYIIHHQSKQIITTNDDDNDVKITVDDDEMPLARTILCCLDTLDESQTMAILSGPIFGPLLSRIFFAASITTAATLTTNENDTMVTLLYRHILPYFRPTMDVACKQVLLGGIRHPRQRLLLLEPTIEWLYDLHVTGKGNPKTTFALIPDLDLLLVLDPASTATQRFLSDVLFHPQHHMEGFLALLQASSDSTFKTYHVTLLRNVEESLQNETKREKMMEMIPLLLECFLVQSKIYVAGKPRQKGLPLAALQFRLFRKWSRHLLLKMDNNQKKDTAADAMTSTTTVLTTSVDLSSLCQMLRSVERHNACLPDKECTSYLTEFVAPLLQVAATATATTTAAVDSAALRDAQTSSDCLCSLLLLNHAVFRDDMEAVVRCAVQSNRFLTAWVDTYKRLRQQHLIYAVLMALADNDHVDERLKKHDDDNNNNNDDSDDFVAQLAAAFSTATLFEIKETLLALEVWYRDQYEKVGALERRVVGRLAAIVLPTVQVDRGNAKDIAKSCQDLVRHAHDFRLCSLCLNLHLQCLFWLGRHVRLEIPEPLLVRLDDETNASIRSSSSDDDDDDHDDKDAVASLLCHQLRENTFLVQETEIYFLQKSNSSNEQTLLEVKQQCERLAQRIAITQCWPVVLMNFHTWFQYAEPQHVEQFCRWIWISVGTSDTISPTIRALLHDASFYEHAAISEQFEMLGYVIVVETMVKLMNDPRQVLGKIACVPFGHDLSRIDALSIEQQTRLLKSVTDLSTSITSDHASVDECAKSCARILRLALQLPQNAVSSVVNRARCIGLLIRIDHVGRSIMRSVVDADSMGFCAVLTACRLSLSMTLVQQYGRTVTCTTTSLDMNTCDLAVPVFQSFIDVVKSMPNASFDTVRELIQSTGKLLYSAAAQPNLTQENVTTAVQLFGALHGELERSTAATVVWWAVLWLCRDFIKFLRSASGTNQGIADQNYQINLQQLYVAIKSLVDKYEATFPSSGNGLDECTECAWLNDSLQNWALASGWLPPDEQAQVRSKVVRNLETTAQPRCTVAACQLSLLPAHDDIMDFLRSVVKASTSIVKIPHDHGEESRAALDSVFCHLIKTLDPIGLSSIATMLLEESSNLVSSLRLMTYCCTQAVNSGQIETLHELARGFYRKGLQTLSSQYVRQGDFSIVEASLRLIKELLLRRDIIVFEESELAGLLSRLPDILHEANKGPIDNHTTSLHMFDLVAKIYLTALQRYTKVLYAFAPVTIYLLRELLVNVLDGPESVQEEKTRSLIRICSLISSTSKDVYKKYAVGVVLAFARRLETGRRLDYIFPAIYLLLDMMSTQHETEQLNALMDVKTRSLFKPVYEGYQKNHVYKG